MSKYDDALELARNYYPDNKFLDTIFPELKPKFSVGDYISNYLSNIADDCDLECILAFLHYPDLPIYKD